MKKNLAIISYDSLKMISGGNSYNEKNMFDFPQEKVISPQIRVSGAGNADYMYGKVDVSVKPTNNTGVGVWASGNSREGINTIGITGTISY